MNFSDDDLTIEEQCAVSEAIFETLTENDEIAQKEKAESEKDINEYRELLAKYGGDHKKTLFEYCFKNNIRYDQAVYTALTKTKEDSVFEQLPRNYVDIINQDERGLGTDFFSQLHQENFEKIYSDVKFLSELSEDDKKNRQQIMDIFSYDPFRAEPVEARPQLYRDLAGMSNEAMRKDVAKQKAALSIVRSYGNIETYQKKIAEITSMGEIDEETQDKLDKYLKVIANIQSTINQTAEKNNFTVKGIGSNGKGMLSDVLVQIDEKGYDKGITNFYDIKTSKAITDINDISIKALLNQINLSKTDYADILERQCILVHECQDKAARAMEALRVAKEKITKQELLEELAADYKKKGIDEEEIFEFIQREFNVVDSVD